MTLRKNFLLMAVFTAISISIIAFALQRDGPELSFEMNTLAGKWKKQTSDACARSYPTNLILLDSGFYEAPGATDEGAFWHGGEWSVASETSLMIQMANDAMATYDYLKDADGSLVITDDQGCRILYTSVA